jgi:hypothetical protein
MGRKKYLRVLMRVLVCERAQRSTSLLAQQQHLVRSVLLLDLIARNKYKF